MPKDKKQASLEKNITHIEKIVEQLETNELSLDNSLSEFEKGINLIRDCQTELTNAEQKIKILTGETPANSSNNINGDTK